jgi:hypothetical protein
MILVVPHLRRQIADARRQSINPRRQIHDLHQQTGQANKDVLQLDASVAAPAAWPQIAAISPQQER